MADGLWVLDVGFFESKLLPIFIVPRLLAEFGSVIEIGDFFSFVADNFPRLNAVTEIRTTARVRTMSDWQALTNFINFASIICRN